MDDFEIATGSQRAADIILDEIDKYLMFPLKQLGLVTLSNGIDVLQTRWYIKLSMETYIEQICRKYVGAWMDVEKDKPMTSLPTKKEFICGFLLTFGDEDSAVQLALSREMGLDCQNRIGEVIFAMITTQPNMYHALTRLSQHNTKPRKIHYVGLQHALKYLMHTRADGIYFWRARPNMYLKDAPPPDIKSNAHDLLLDGRPHHGPLNMHGYMDSEWATCPLTRRSVGSRLLMLA